MRSLLLAGALAAILVSATIARASFPGSNGLIAFERKGSIYTIDTAGKHLTRLTTGHHPSWSRDGKSLVFHRGGNGIYVMGANGTNVKRVSAKGFDAVWAADGASIVFTTTEAPDSIDCTPTAPFAILESVPAAGGDATLFTPRSVAEDICGVPGGDDFATVTKDGRVAFQHDELEVHDIYSHSLIVAAADGTHRKTLRIDGKTPDWSPDGKQLAYTATYKGNDELWLGVPNTGTKQRLTRSEGGNSAPAWSPDGKKLVFTRRSGSPVGLVVLNLKTGKLTRLTTSATDYWPDWQPA